MKIYVVTKGFYHTSGDIVVGVYDTIQQANQVVDKIPIHDRSMEWCWIEEFKLNAEGICKD